MHLPYQLIENLKYFSPSILWSLVILGLSISPSIQLPASFFSPDKLGHFVVYSILSGLILWGFEKKRNYSKNDVILAIVVSSLYGASLEIIQYCFFPNRFFELGDMLANFIGAVSGYYLFRLIKRFLLKWKKKEP